MVARKRSIIGNVIAFPIGLAKIVIASFSGGPNFTKRLTVLIGVFAVWTLVLIGRQAQLQIIHGEDYRELADSRHTYRRLIPPMRGRITDRNGVVLAFDEPAFDLSIIPAKAKLTVVTQAAAERIVSADPAERNVLRAELIQKALAGEPMIDALVKLIGCERDRLARALVTAMENVAKRHYNSHMSQVIVGDIPKTRWLQLKTLQENPFGVPPVPGIVMTTSLRRRYPFGRTVAHVVGNIGLLQKEHYDSLRRSGVLLSLSRIKRSWWKQQWDADTFDPDLKSLLVRSLVQLDEPPDTLRFADVLVTRIRASDPTARARIKKALTSAGFENVVRWLTQRDTMRLSAGEWKWLSGANGARMLSSNIVGETGVEGMYNDLLRGRAGYRVRRRTIGGVIPINPITQDGRYLDKDGYAPDCRLIDGEDITLTLDMTWQRAAEKALAKRDIPGAVVMINPNTGEILAMVSYPTFDLNDFTPPRSSAVSDYLDDPRHPLLNRVVQGTYQQASCFKIVGAVAIFETLKLPVTITHDCDGVEIVGKGKGGRKLCHGGYGCGPGLTVVDALSRSCNDFFYHYSLKLKDGALQKWARLFGYGARTGIDLPGESAGLVPSPEWKATRKGNFNRWERIWRPADTCDMAIGLGAWLVTPLQSAVMVSAIANGGMIVRPHVVKNPALNSPVRLLDIRPDVLAAVRKGLFNCANGSPKGLSFATGFKAFHNPATPLPPWLKVAGKTGTTDRVRTWDSEQKKFVKKRSNAWFVGYAPADNPTVAFAVILEHGGGGGSAAAPVINDILHDVYADPSGNR